MLTSGAAETVPANKKKSYQTTEMPDPGHSQPTTDHGWPGSVHGEFDAGADRIFLMSTKPLHNQHLIIILLMTVLASVIATSLYILFTDERSLGIVVLLCSITGTATIATFLAHRQVAAFTAITAQARKLATVNRESTGAPAAGSATTELEGLLDQIRERLDTTTASDFQLDLLLDAMNDAVVLTDIDGNIIRLNESALQMLAYSGNELYKKSIRILIAAEHRDEFRLSDEKRPIETIFITQQGNKIPVSYTTSRLDADLFSFAGFIIAARNISERKVTEQRIRYLARIDTLTKLSNRMQFHHLLQRSISRARRRKHQIAMFYLDIDRFKDINDTFGHAAGDTCLETIANRLVKLLPEKAIIGRLAGDEFAAAIEWDGPQASLAAYIQSTTRHMLTELTRLLIIQGHEIHTTLSIGISCYPKDADNVIDLIRSADAALYRAKKMPGSSFEFFDAQMNAEEVDRLMLKSKLRRSYELDELLIHYQPKIDIKSGQVSGAEALVRWELSERGLILPSEFIPLAEETNLIIEIGEWVLNKVCNDLRHWQNKLQTPGRIAINLSLKQLAQPNFPHRIKAILDHHHIDPSCLELEITESTLMHDTEHTVALLRQLHELGLTLSIDDFGTGYSSLSALQQFPISTLKIDKSFVHDMQTSKDGTKIISAIINLAHSMNMDVIAEGVESELQLRQLKALNCDHVQGLLFGKPMDADSYFELLSTAQNGQLSYGNFFG